MAGNKKKGGLDLSALDGFATLGLADLGTGITAAPNGKALEINLADIHEDPDQPRRIFDESSLKELAENIKERGVIQPISVRPRPEGGYYINVGARRFRASVMAGLQTIPAIILEMGTDTLRFAQMAENIHRENLTPLEIGHFILSEVAKGKKKGEIAKALGKGSSFVSHHVKLAEGPAWIQDLSVRGVCSDVQTLSELIKLDESGKVENLQERASGLESISRADVKTLEQRSEPAPQAAPADQGHADEADTQESGEDFGQEPAADSLTPIEPVGQVDQGSAEGAAAAQEVGEGNSKNPAKEKEPVLEKTVFIGGRKAYLQTKKVEVWWEDTGVFEKILLRDLPSEALGE